MKVHPSLWLFIATLFLLGCSSEDSPREEIMPDTFLFEDDFETVSGELEELFPTDQSRWSTLQQTNPSGAVNEISLSTAQSSLGASSLRILARQSDALLSKMDIEKSGLNIAVGSRVIIAADFFIPGTQPLTNLLLIDLECCSCWDPDVGDNFGAENQCPGVRLMMTGDEDYLAIERGKISGTTLVQAAIPFPRNQWVNVVWEMTLAPDDTGQNLLRIDGVEVINERAMNLPNAAVFRDVFAQEGITFELADPAFYERVQIGATANPIAGDVEMYIDNFSIRIEQ